MELDGLTFPEAVEALAEMAGLEVPRERTTGPKIDSSVYDTLETAAQRYRQWLGEGAEGTQARAYLRERGLGAETIDRFGVGLALPGWDRLKTALGTLGEGRLVEAGLVAKNERGRTYDRFRDRVVFPIRNTRGRVIGFGGRVFGSASTDGPKYLNSPDTPHFSKGRELYGLYEARQTPRRLDSVIVVEGYMDVLALAEHGIDNAVATLGTAIGKSALREAVPASHRPRDVLLRRRRRGPQRRLEGGGRSVPGPLRRPPAALRLPARRRRPRLARAPPRQGAFR